MAKTFKTLGLYSLAILALCLGFYFFSQQYLKYEEDKLRYSYVELLNSMHKPHEQVESAFLSKNPHAHEKFDENIPTVKQLSQDDLVDRLVFLQRDLQAVPDTFPLFANTPRVSDVLAWLSQHPTVAFIDEEGKSQSRLQIENFNYFMVKRPLQGKKQEKYQIKIELEFSSNTPKEAREFHDALITPNDWVDPKGEIKWSSNRGKYRTSFFFKKIKPFTLVLKLMLKNIPLSRAILYLVSLGLLPFIFIVFMFFLREIK